ncbi:MAG TPA: phosphoribosyltransferase family protein [Candidatus Saccharimonadales bacterium]|nr:phosphoribosyltransferase family protein [Candidatus Saccharimonadales bacterium]
MYFKSRAEAGRILADQLDDYEGKNCSVIALSRGGVLIGGQIASKLHSNLMLLLAEQIILPGEPEPVAAVTSDNAFTENSLYSIGEIEEFEMEFYNYIQEERFQKLHKLHLLLGTKGEIDKAKLRHHTVILTSDGLNTGFSVEIAINYLKSISFKKLVVATTFSTPEAYERLRVLSDELYCLSMVENFLGVDHYYEDNAIPDVDKLMEYCSNISLHWDKN